MYFLKFTEILQVKKLRKVFPLSKVTPYSHSQEHLLAPPPFFLLEHLKKHVTDCIRYTEKREWTIMIFLCVMMFFFCFINLKLF